MKDLQPMGRCYWQRVNGKLGLFTSARHCVAELPENASRESRAMAELDYLVPKLPAAQRKMLERLQEAAPHGVPIAAWAGILPMLGKGLRFEALGKYVGINGQPAS